MRFEQEAFYLKSAADMAALFPDHREALLNTRRIAEMVDLELPLGQLRIPHFPVPDGETVETWLTKECQRGLEQRYGGVTPVLQERLDYELGVICSMGYAGLLPDRRGLRAVRPGAGHRDHVPGLARRARS